MAHTDFNQNSEDAQAAADKVAADQAAKVAADKAAAAEAARVEAERVAADEAADAEAANQNEAAAQDPRDELVQVVLDPEFAEAYDVDVATVGTANGEYELSSTPVDVARRDLDNVLASPAAKENE